MGQRIYNTAANDRVLSLITQQSNGLALDIGCGTGKLGVALKQLGFTVNGITFDEEEYSHATENYNHIWLANLENGLPDTSIKYDLIVASHILEHVVFPEKMINDIKTSLNKDGTLICAIPNMLFLYNRIKLLCGTVEYEEYGLMDSTHVKWYTIKSLQELFSNNGFECDAFKANGNLPLGPIRRILPDSILSFLDRKIVSRFPGLLAWELVFRFKHKKQTR